MASFWGELKRRNVVKVAVAYAVVSWLLLEVASILGPALRLPDWAISLVVFLLILGFPVALFLTWAYEMTPEGVKLEKDVDRSKSITRLTSRKLDYFIIAALSMSLVFVVIDQYVIEEQGEEAVVIDAGSVSNQTEQESESDLLPNSVAVLPFSNFSPNPDDAYFAAGMHEAIISQVARIQALNVIARTTVMQYAESAPPVPQIARDLRVETILEGSVRYAGDRVLVTAQLIDGSTGAHLWVDEYEGDLSDIFGIQSDISINIANALKIQLSAQEQNEIATPPTESPEAYALYLSAVAENIGDPRWIQKLQAAVEIDPEFALAHAQLANSYAFNIDEERTRFHAERALELDDTLALAHIALARLYSSTWRPKDAEEYCARAINLAPSDLAILAGCSRLGGDLENAVRYSKQLYELDPGNHMIFRTVAWDQWFLGDRDGAMATTRQEIAMTPEVPNFHMYLGMMEATVGNRQEAIRQLLLAERLYQDNSQFDTRHSGVTLGYAYRVAGATEDAIRTATKWGSSVVDELPLSRRVYYHLARNEEQQALEALRRGVDDPPGRFALPLGWIIHNSFEDPVLNQPAFQAFRDQLKSDLGMQHHLIAF